MAIQKYECGMIGLGQMGRGLSFNIDSQGHSVIGFDKDTSLVELYNKSVRQRETIATSRLPEFVEKLKSPRVIMMMLPAGNTIDEIIQELLPHLSENDLLVDCGNSHYTDTNRRLEELTKMKIRFLGIGISGGEIGARFGPCMMAGGSKDAYDDIAEMLTMISAFVKDGDSCVSWLGPGSAGHYVKMVHNGIEYGLMQNIAEVYHLLKSVLKMNNDHLHIVFNKWNEGRLHSFLMEITAEIFVHKDELTHHELIDMILDKAQQHGTGAWTSEDAMKLQVPVPTIDAAVSARNLLAYNKERKQAEKILLGPEIKFNGNINNVIDWAEQALYFSMIITYAQGLSLLKVASKEYSYNLNPEEITRIWRGGSIIRSTLLDEIHATFAHQHELSNFLLSISFSKKLMDDQNGIRKLIQLGVKNGIPMPAMMGSLAYFDSYRSGWLPANLVQAERDYFGGHTYERTDREGVFHTEWNH